ncbi:MAG TPA: tRNA (adenosine(37)-N6)-dimethylallyltransferase MiaA [Bacillales bacterium]|nr:tRNA (adenosine(37)-N6)-dimethylallyltransferase MiaA [Bacillales bacterium]
MKEKLIVVVGPTAVGKTKVSVELANRLGGEIINGDSMQVYKGMDIGTAKITEEETKGVPHHLFNIKQPIDSYSAAEFQDLARPLVTAINERGKIPIVVGGTGMYIKALTHHFNFTDTASDRVYREKMEKFAEEHGNEKLHERLKDIDPESAAGIHPNNVRRVIRALEVFHATGIPASERKEKERESPYLLAPIGLTMEREKLYERINQRVDEMIKEGLIEEVRGLYESGIGECQSIQAIGYKEIYAYLRGDCSMEEAVSQLKQNSRRYAKKQYTWFLRQMDIRWFDVTDGDFEKKISSILRFVQERFRQ